MKNLYRVTLFIILIELPFNHVQALSINRREIETTDSDLQYLSVFPETSANCSKETEITHQKDNGSEPPEFLRQMVERLSLDDKTVTRDVGIIARALHPVSFAYGNIEASANSEASSVLTFNISRENLANFHTAKIVFSSLNNSTNLQLHAGSHMWVKVNLLRRSEKQSQSLEPSKQFYEHDFTNFLKQNQNWTNTKTQHALLKLEIVVFKNNRRKEVSLKQVFDVGKDQPFILLQYGGGDEDDPGNDSNLEPDADSWNEIVHFEDSSFEYRGRRSPQDASDSRSKLCRRQEWRVKPAEVGLTKIAAPEFLDLGFCAGPCQFPLNASLNSTHYATFVNQYRLNIFGEPSDSTCKLPSIICVPVSYKPKILIQSDDSGFAIISYENGAVDSCGCAE